jgi:putative ABC transport system permease protein
MGVSATIRGRQVFDTRWRKALRDVWLHRARSLLVVIAMALGLIGAGALLNTWALVQRATQQGYLTSLPVSATLNVDRADAALLNRVRALPGIAAARARRTVMAVAQVGAASHKTVLYAMDDFDNPGIARLQSDSGPWPPQDDSLTIERSSLEFSGARLGESLQLKLHDSAARSLKVSGILRDVSLAPGWMEHVIYGYVTPATLAQLGDSADFDEVQIRVSDADADRDAVRRIASRVKQSIEAAGGHVYNVDVPTPGEHIHAAQMNSLMMTQGAFGGLTLLVCTLLVVNLISALLAGQSREIGVMKTLGATPEQIAAIYLGMALLFGVLASSIALPMAIALGRFYAEFRGEMLNFPITGYAIPAWVIVVQLATGCLLPVAAAALPVLRACRISVGSALRDSGIVVTGSGLHTRRRIAWGGISRPLLLSIGNAFRRRQRMLLTLLALAAGGAVYLGAANLREAVRGSVDLLFSSQRYDFSLRFTEPHPTSLVETTVMRIAGVERAEAWRSAGASVEYADATQGGRFTVTAVPIDSRLLKPALQEGRWLTATDRNALVVSRGLLRNEPGLSIGSDVSLTMNATTRSWTIIGIVDSGPQPMAYASRVALDSMYGDDSATSVVVAASMRGMASQLDLIQRLRSAFAAAGMPVSGSQMLSENRRVVEDHLLMVVDFLGAMAWVMMLVGGMGLASTMSLAVMERTREIGVLRAIGAGHRAIMTMIQIESLVIALLAWLLAMPLSLPMSVALSEAFGRVMFAVPTSYLPNLEGSLHWLIWVTGISLIASAWPAWRAMRIPTAAALSYE